MKRSSFDGLAWLGWLVFLFALANWLSGFKSRWTLGPRYGMPKTLVGPDGLTFLDGSPLDPVSLWLVRSGQEEEIVLALAVMLGLGVLVVIREIIAYARVRRQLRELLAAEARLDAQEHLRRH